MLNLQDSSNLSHLKLWLQHIN